MVLYKMNPSMIIYEKISGQKSLVWGDFKDQNTP